MPILRVIDQPVFDGVDPAIFHMRRKVGIVADVVFPEPFLPNGGFGP
jgi:hypothetical protein